MAPRSGISIMSAEMRQDALTMHQTMKQKMTLADLVPDDSAAAASKKPRSIGLEQEKILQNVFDCFADAKLGRVVLDDYNPDKQPGPGEARFVGSGYLRSSERLNDIMHAFGLTRYSKNDADGPMMGPGRGFCPHEILEMTNRFFEEQEVNKFVRAKSTQESAHATSSIGKGDKSKKISFLELSMLVSKEPELARKWDQYYQTRVNDARFRKKQGMDYNKEYDVEPDSDGASEKHLDPFWQMEQAFKILIESYGKKSPTGSGEQELDIQVLRNVLSSCGDELQVDQFDDFLGQIKHPLRGTLNQKLFVEAVKRASHLDSVHFVQEEEPDKQAEPFSRADIEKIYEEAMVYGQEDLEALPEDKLRSIAERKGVTDFTTLPMKQLKNYILASQIETRHLVAQEDLPDPDADAKVHSEQPAATKPDDSKAVKKDDAPKKKSSKDAPDDKTDKKSKEPKKKSSKDAPDDKKDSKPKESPRKDKSPKESPRKDKDEKKESPRKEKDEKKESPRKDKDEKKEAKDSPRKEKDDKKDSPRKDKDEKKERKASPSPEPKEKNKEDK